VAIGTEPSVTEAPVVDEPVAGPQVDPEGHRPLRELLPTGRGGIAAGSLGLFLAVASFAVFGFTGHAVIGAIFMPILVLLAAIDLQHRLLPNVIVLPAALVVLALEAFAAPADLPSHVYAGLALGGFFLVFALLLPAGLGMGDVKLGLLIGFALGSATLSAMLVAFFAVFVFAIGMMAKKGLGARKMLIPFGPFLALGGIVAYLFT
jgi:prepilin signal peptidase PulO-like enzyme (type II secretory pathway)